VENFVPANEEHAMTQRSSTYDVWSIMLGIAIIIIALMLWCLAFASQNVAAQTTNATKHPYGSDESLSEPRIFAEGAISTGDFESHPAFSPDGKTLYFVRSTPNFSLWTILVSRFAEGRWSTPEVAPFSGQYSDADPFITSDGSRLYFISNRPVVGKSTPDLDIWVMEKTAAGWSEPKNVGAPINSSGSEWYPTVAASGTIYFGSDREGGKGRTDIYRSRFVNGKYTEAENLGDAINTQANEFEPLIAPDESFLIIMAGGRSDARGGWDLYISYNRNGMWTKPANLGDKINSSGNEYSPIISPDSKYFFWTSTRGFADKPLEKRLNYQGLMNRLRSPRNGLGDIYQIDIGELLVDKPRNDGIR
jgi:Periplasmic component of the Tol biopolymer transport system